MPREKQRELERSFCGNGSDRHKGAKATRSYGASNGAAVLSPAREPPHREQKQKHPADYPASPHDKDINDTSPVSETVDRGNWRELLASPVPGRVDKAGSTCNEHVRCSGFPIVPDQKKSSWRGTGGVRQRISRCRRTLQAPSATRPHQGVEDGDTACCQTNDGVKMPPVGPARHTERSGQRGLPQGEGW